MNKKGFTIIEVTVTLAVSAIVVAGGVTFFSEMQRVYIEGGYLQADIQRRGDLVVQRMMRDIREAQNVNEVAIADVNGNNDGIAITDLNNNIIDYYVENAVIKRRVNAGAAVTITDDYNVMLDTGQTTIFTVTDPRVTIGLELLDTDNNNTVQYNTTVAWRNYTAN